MGCHALTAHVLPLWEGAESVASIRWEATGLGWHSHLLLLPVSYPRGGQCSPSLFLRPSSSLPAEAADRCMEEGGGWPLIWNDIPPPRS